MRSFRNLLVLMFVVFAAIVEVCWLSPLGLPGAIPPLTLVFVLALALRREPQNAALLGFAAGMIVDLMPPSTTSMGISAFSFAALAYLLSSNRAMVQGSIVLPLLTIAGAAGVSTILRILVAVAAGVGQNVGDNFAGNLATSVLYSAMLATVIFPASLWLDRLVTPRKQRTIYR